MIGLDVETTALTPDEGRLRIVQLSGDRGTKVYDVDELTREDVRYLFDYAASRPSVAHNANFEELWMRHYGVEAHLEDTMVMSRVLYGGTDGFKRRRHTLADCVERELEIKLDKEQQTSDWSGPLSDAQFEYAAKDAEILRPLAGKLLTRLAGDGLTPTYELENRVRPAVDAMERRGVAVHRDRLEALIAEYTDKAETLKQELADLWGINPGSRKQLAEHFELHERCGWPKTKGEIRRRIKRFPAETKPSKHRLDMPNTPCWGVVSQVCGFQVFSGFFRRQPANFSKCK